MKKKKEEVKLVPFTTSGHFLYFMLKKHHELLGLSVDNYDMIKAHVWMNVFLNPLFKVIWKDGEPVVPEHQMIPLDQIEYNLLLSPWRVDYNTGNKYTLDRAREIMDSNEGHRYDFRNFHEPFFPSPYMFEVHHSFVEEKDGWAVDGKFNTPCLDNPLNAVYMSRVAWMITQYRSFIENGSDSDWWWARQYDYSDFGCNRASFKEKTNAYFKFIASRIFPGIEFSQIKSYVYKDRCQELLNQCKMSSNSLTNSAL